MSDEYREESQDGEGGMLMWGLVILLLLMGAGVGAYYLMARQGAARQADMQAAEAVRRAAEAQKGKDVP